MIIKPISQDDYVYTMAEFREMCIDKSFIDYDGHGVYAVSRTQKTDVIVHPSDVVARQTLRYPFVVWYNK